MKRIRIRYICVVLAYFNLAAVQRDERTEVAEGSAKSAEDCQETKAAQALRAAAKGEERRAVEAMIQNSKLPADKVGTGPTGKASGLGSGVSMESCKPEESR